MLLQCQQDGFLAVIDAIDQVDRSLIFLKEENVLTRGLSLCEVRGLSLCEVDALTKESLSFIGSDSF